MFSLYYLSSRNLFRSCHLCVLDIIHCLHLSLSPPPPHPPPLLFHSSHCSSLPFVRLFRNPRLSVRQLTDDVMVCPLDTYAFENAWSHVCIPAARLLQGVLRLAACVCVCVCVREREGGTQREADNRRRESGTQRESGGQRGEGGGGERERGEGGLFCIVVVCWCPFCFVFCLFVLLLFCLLSFCLSLPPPPPPHFSPTYFTLSLSLSGFIPFPVNPLVYVCLHR